VTALAILPGLFHNVSMAKQRRKPKAPDPASFAFGILQHVIEATGDVPAEPAPKPIEPGKDPAAVALGRKGGLKGGPIRAARLSPEERTRLAKKAAEARWRQARQVAEEQVESHGKSS
jgi:hypothetical protein